MLELFFPILIIFIVFCIVEFIAYSIISSVNKKFQWLIMQKDENPTLSESGLKKFLPHGFDPELGWIRKPNTSHEEIGKYGKTRWTINNSGARLNSDYDKKQSIISCYGDSFTFCRQVNDDGTWEHYLSKKLKTNVKNFAVGNYGIDQALLRLKRDFHDNRTPIVILAVVPDTISRIVSIWKHYYEYGNTFGFKPRFVIKNSKLELIKNPINEIQKFQNYQRYLTEIKQNDFFYEAKFKKEKLHFPYCITIFKNVKRNFSLLYWNLLIENKKKMNHDVSGISWNPMKIIMKTNLEWRIRLFHDKISVELLKKIIEEYVKFGKENNFKPIFSFLPQKDDLIFIKNNYHFYNDFIKKLKNIENLIFVDVTEKLLEESDLDILYSDNNDYGGHYSKHGNEKVSSIFYSSLKNLT